MTTAQKYEARIKDAASPTQFSILLMQAKCECIGVLSDPDAGCFTLQFNDGTLLMCVGSECTAHTPAIKFLDDTFVKFPRTMREAFGERASIELPPERKGWTVFRVVQLAVYLAAIIVVTLAVTGGLEKLA